MTDKTKSINADEDKDNEQTETTINQPGKKFPDDEHIVPKKQNSENDETTISIGN